ncbi:hypothetical protein N8612_02645 [Verrucomicrobia bacterium]|nr:hypothetical protein [Verrucomicrobiota bacterium]
MKTSIVLNMFSDFGGLIGRNALRAFFALQEALKNVIGSSLGAARRGLKELFAQSATSHTVNSQQFFTQKRAFLNKGIDLTIRHLIMYTLRYISSTSYPFADALILFGLLSRHTPPPSLDVQYPLRLPPRIPILFIKSDLWLKMRQSVLTRT